MPMKSFRGLMIDGAQNTIVLHTNNGSTGYRIVKFEMLPATPGAVSQESVMKIYKIEQSAVDGVIDFSDNTLIAAGFYSDGAAAGEGPADSIITFDNEIFNQDIYITHSEVGNNESCNYYIELEQVKLNLDENTVATLKDIRNITQNE